MLVARIAIYVANWLLTTYAVMNLPDILMSTNSQQHSKKQKLLKKG